MAAEHTFRARRAGGRVLVTLAKSVAIFVAVFFVATFVTFGLRAMSGLSPARIQLGEDATPEADREALASSVKASRARLSVVRGAHHDVLNDVQHRSVAAEIVSFLEVLRNELVPVISVESSAW
jgi:ABC-type dipeptide/oligopeptide/nickel transport system permease component